MATVIDPDNIRHWALGEVAQACGVTVRTLHHYDQIGLLTPEHRTASGHRRYTERDLRRLYRIRALQALGLSLDDVADTLAGPDDLTGLRDVLTAQAQGIADQITRLTAIRDRITELLHQIDARQAPDPNQLMTTLEMMSVYETYFTQQQRDQLAQRRAELGPDAVDATRTEWISLVEGLLPHVAADTPADDPEVADLLDRWDRLAARMHPTGTAGEETAQAARRMWQDNAAELSTRLPWPADRMTALVTYIDEARRARQSS